MGAALLIYINAGHNSPLLVHALGRVERLDVGGFPVGVTPDGEYREWRVRLEPGDVLAIYSDGVTESLDKREEEFGEARLVEVIQQHRASAAAGIYDRILTLVITTISAKSSAFRQAVWRRKKSRHSANPA